MARSVAAMRRLLLRPTKYRCFSPVQRRCLSHKPVESSSVDDAASAASLREKLLRAPFQRVANTGSPLFPWRHSDQLMPRLIPGSPEFEEKGLLLGGNVVSSNPKYDAYATGYLFLNVPWYKMIFFQQWQDDLAESISWAFARGMAGILSNVYRVPFDKIHKADSKLDFDHGLGSSSSADGEEASSSSSDSIVLERDLDYMIERRLRELYESAKESGKEQIQVRLESEPIGAEIVNIFVFPFLSRGGMRRNAGLEGTYRQLLELMVVSPRDALPIYHDFVADFQERGVTESTVICQVLVHCEEVFWVKDLATGATVQGYDDEKVRNVVHLVRMEMVVEAHPAPGSILPFKHKKGNWIITDIDDLLDGNQLL